jgi:hypothetical protein
MGAALAGILPGLHVPPVMPWLTARGGAEAGYGETGGSPSQSWVRSWYLQSWTLA